MFSENHSWHPVGDFSITPLKAQLLFACRTPRTVDDLLTLTANLFVDENTMHCALQNLMMQNWLWRCFVKEKEFLTLSTNGHVALQRLQQRSPQFVEMTQRMIFAAG